MDLQLATWVINRFHGSLSFEHLRKPTELNQDSGCY